MILSKLNTKNFTCCESRPNAKLVIFFLLSIIILSSCGTPVGKVNPSVTPIPTAIAEEPTQQIDSSVLTQLPLPPPKSGTSRGYLTTPQELKVIAQKAQQGIEPYQTYENELLDWANRDW